MAFAFCARVYRMWLRAEGMNQDAAEAGQEAARVAAATSALSGRPSSGVIACCLCLEKKKNKGNRAAVSQREREKVWKEAVAPEKIYLTPFVRN